MEFIKKYLKISKKTLILPIALAFAANIKGMEISPTKPSEKGNRTINALQPERGPNILDKKDSNGKTSSNIASRTNQIEIIYSLEGQGKKQQVTNSQDNGPSNNNTDIKSELLDAVSKGNLYLAKLALANGANIDEKNKNGKTALMLAVRDGHQDLIKLLLDSGANIDEKDNNNETALDIAQAWGNKTKILQLLTNHTKQQLANLQGNISSNNASDVKSEKKLLLDAAAKGDLDRVTLAITNSSIEEKNIMGETALMLSAQYGHNDIVTFLLDHGAKIDEKNILGDTALIKAARHGHKDLVALFIKKGAKIDEKNNFGSTALMLAALCDHKEVVILLLENNATIDQTNDFNETSLETVQEYMHPEIAQLLNDHISKQQTNKLQQNTSNNKIIKTGLLLKKNQLNGEKQQVNNLLALEKVEEGKKCWIIQMPSEVLLSVIKHCINNANNKKELQKTILYLSKLNRLFKNLVESNNVLEFVFNKLEKIKNLYTDKDHGIFNWKSPAFDKDSIKAIKSKLLFDIKELTAHNNKRLLDAAKNGQSNIILTALANGADIEVTDFFWHDCIDDFRPQWT